MSEPFLGEIRMLGFSFAPRGWALCQGQILPTAQNEALFSLLGTIYGGDGRTTFALPDLRGRVPSQFGTGPGLSPRSQGETGGTESTTLVVGNLPSHTHPLTANADDANSGNPTNNRPAAAVGAPSSPSIYSNQAGNAQMQPTGTTGNGQAVNNMQPYLVINFSIALVGLFPSRN